jgi:hypothetical protein
VTPEEVDMPESHPLFANVKRLPGTVVPIPTFPLLARYRIELAARPASPPADLWKLRELLFKRLKVSVPAFPVGTAKDRLPEIVAVGVPPAILIKPNFAEEVDVPPINKSSVELPEYIVPFAIFH